MPKHTRKVVIKNVKVKLAKKGKQLYPLEIKMMTVPCLILVEKVMVLNYYFLNMDHFIYNAQCDGISYWIFNAKKGIIKQYVKKTQHILDNWFM